jgi:hypothetical protein
MSEHVTGFAPTRAFSERDSHTLSATTYTPTDGTKPTIYITKRYSTGREQSIGMDTDEARALIQTLLDLLDRSSNPANSGQTHGLTATR